MNNREQGHGDYSNNHSYKEIISSVVFVILTVVAMSFLSGYLNS